MTSAADQALLQSIYNLEQKRERYKRAKRAISSNQLHRSQDLETLEQYINHCKSLVAVVDGEVGYAYLATLREKLQEDIKILQQYHDYCTDANESFKALYNHLDSSISALSTTISSKKNSYNDGKPFWEWVW